MRIEFEILKSSFLVSIAFIDEIAEFFDFSRFKMLWPLLNIGTVTSAVTEYESFLSTDLDDFKDLPTEPDTENSGVKFKLLFLISNFDFHIELSV